MRFLIFVTTLIFATLSMSLTACGGSEEPQEITADGGKGKQKGKKAKGKKGKGKKAGKGKGKKGKGKKGAIGKNQAYDDNQTCCRKNGVYSYGGSRKACKNRGGNVIEGGESCLLICCQTGGSVQKVLKGNCKGRLVPDRTCGA